MHYIFFIIMALTNNNTDIHQLSGGSSNIYILKSNNNVMMIDAGNKGKLESISKQLKKINLSVEDIDYILLTHTHYDHVGSLQALQKVSKAKIIVHKNERENLEKGEKEFPKGTNAFTKIISGIGKTFLKKMAGFSPVKADIIVEDTLDLSLFGFNAFAFQTPGHTNGSMCILVNHKKLIVGDSMFNIIGKKVIPPYADDIELLLKSWKEILKYNCETYYPGHGNPFDKEKAEKSYDIFVKKVLKQQ